ncbi:MAG: MBL fold metallo-hydrolase [Lachnospiraceae bacterium]|nr:MBL fold metallo-hydrolase [Lachnospiraceae bacterium]
MRRLKSLLIVLAVMLTTACGEKQVTVDPGCTTRIHFVCISKDNAAMDCILLESEGRFGLVDCGYWDQREQITDSMSALGVTKDNLEFIIGTHAHADHIGAMNYLVQNYNVERIYLMPFSADCLTKPEEWYDESWDNVMKTADEKGLIVVDTFEEGASETPWLAESDESDLLGAAESEQALSKVGTEKKSGEPGDAIKTIEAQRVKGRGKAGNHYTTSPHITFGDAELDILNYSQDYLTEKVVNANDASLVVKVTAGGHTALLCGDVSNAGPRGKDPGYDEKKVAEMVGHVDILHLPHHGYGWYDTNIPEDLKKFDADHIVQTGATSMLFTEKPDTYDEIIREVKKGATYVSTFWYDRRVMGGDGLYAITYNMSDLTSNIPADVSILAVNRDGKSVMFKAGRLAEYNYDDKTYLSNGIRNDYGTLEIDGIIYEIDNNGRIIGVSDAE